MKKAVIFLISAIMALFLTACDLSTFFRVDNTNPPKTSSGNNIIRTDYEDAFNLATKGTSVLTGPQIYKKVAPSVVGILNYESTSSIAYSSEGSGIIMDEEGYIITNAHVIADAAMVKVVLNNGAIYTAEQGAFWYDKLTDIGLIKINLPDGVTLTPAEFGNSDELEIGEDVYAIGNPGGLEYSSSMTRGIVSGLDREIESYDDYNVSTGYTVKCIQTDAAINPGNSGGALINVYGQVIGINSAKIVADGFEGMGFAITINEAQPLLSELKANGRITGRAALGITVSSIFDHTIKCNGVYSSIRGLYVASVTNANPTQLAAGDIIAEIDGFQIESLGSVTAILKGRKPGDPVSIKIYRLTTGIRLKSFNTYYYEATTETKTLTLVESVS